MDMAISVAGVPIRLTYERWFHIVENHDDVAGYYDDILETVENPDLGLARLPRHTYCRTQLRTSALFNGGVSPSVCRRWLYHHGIFHEQT